MSGWSERERAEEFGGMIRDLVSKPDFASRDLQTVASLSRWFQLECLAHTMAVRLGPTVRKGPFAGMELIPVQLGSVLMPKILGTYESEIAHLFADLGRFRRVVDVGSAEGYYAVGCPYAYPHIRTLAYDTSEAAQRRCRQAAELNGVADRVEQREFCTPDELARLADDGTLFVIDIDGGEIDLLCALPAERLARAEMIVEAHKYGATTTEEAIVPHFAATHEVTIYRQQMKEVDEPMLAQSPSFTRWLVTWEGRMNEVWLHLRPKA